MLKIGDRVKHEHIPGIGTVVESGVITGPVYFDYDTSKSKPHLYVVWDGHEHKSLHAIIYLTRVTPVEELAAVGQVTRCLK